MKYIEADKLKEEIKRQMNVEIEECHKSKHPQLFKFGRVNALENLIPFIDSLQQEQPEVDLENEINAVWNPRFNLGWDEHSALSMNHAGFASIARHFYELGLNARKD